MENEDVFYSIKFLQLLLKKYYFFIQYYEYFELYNYKKNITIMFLFV